MTSFADRRLGSPLAGDPSRVPGPLWDTFPVGVRVACPAFVGRADELAALREARARAIGGRATTVLIGGDAGVGKSRLVAQLAAEDAGVPIHVATGFCPPGGRNLPFAAIVGLLKDLTPQLDDERAVLLQPALAALGLRDLQAQVGTELSGVLARTALFNAIITALTDLAERTPLTLVIEDLHWADSGALELFDVLARSIGDAPILLIGTYRSDEVDRDHLLRPIVAELRRSPATVILNIGGFDEAGVAQQMAAILGHDPDPKWSAAVHARCGGNAFFVEELTASGPDGELPSELQDLLMVRAVGLSTEAQSVLNLAATIGANIGHQLLVDASGMDGDDLQPAIAEVVDRQLLVVAPHTAGYEFRHALVREAVYDSLLPGDRVRLHRHVATARALSHHPTPAAELARHWWEAGEWGHALHTSLAAAEDADRVFAFAEALAHRERALAAWDRASHRDSSSVDRLALLEATADGAYLAGDPERSVELARMVVDAIDRDEDPERAAVAITRLGRSITTTEGYDAALAHYTEAESLLDAARPTQALAQVLAHHAGTLMVMARMHDAAEICERAIAAAETSGNRGAECNAINTLGCTVAALGQPDEGLALMRKAVELAEEIGDAGVLNRAYTNLSSLLLDESKLEQAAAVTLDSIAVGEEMLGIKLYGAAMNSAEALILLGRWAEADVLLADQRHIKGSCTSHAQLLRPMLALRRGQLDDAEALVEIADRATRSMVRSPMRAWYLMTRAELELERGRAAEAKDLVDEALSETAGTDEETFIPTVCAFGARVLADLDDQHRGTRANGRYDADKTRMLVAALVEQVERLAAAPVERGGTTMPRVVATVAWARAEQSRLHGGPPEPWAEAAAEWRALGQPFEQAYALWREAEAWLRRAGGGARAAATAALHEAARLVHPLGDNALTRRIEDLAQRARISLDAAGPASGAADPTASAARDLGLTAREAEVLIAVAAGRTDRQIAEELFISRKTVSVHVSNILRKLDVTNRVDAGDVARRAGLLG